MSRFPFLHAALLVVFAAGSAGAESTRVGSRRTAIVGGEPSGQEDDAVVRILSPAPPPYVGFACNGVLVAPNVVVTQLSCVSLHEETIPFSCTTEGTLAAPDLGGGWIGEPFDPGEIQVFFAEDQEHPAFGTAVFGTNSTTLCVDNIAFMVLDRDLPSQGFPVRLDRGIDFGETMTVIGWGTSGETGSGRFRRGGVPVLGVGPEDTSRGPGIAAPRTFLLGEGPCTGDGGSAALSDETGALTGIFSISQLSASSYCEDEVSIYVRIAPYESLLRRALSAAGAEPRLEGEPGPSGDGAQPGCGFHGSARPRGLALLELLGALSLARRRHAHGEAR